MRQTTIAVVSIVVLTSVIGCENSKKEAIALLRLKPMTTESGTAREPLDYEVFCQTQVALIESPFVLNAALKRLRDQEKQVSVEDAPSPIDEIKSGLSTSRPGKSEILRVSFAGRNPPESVLILDAVMDAYLEEVAAAERNERVQRLTLLKSKRQKQRQELVGSLEAVRQLEDELGSSYPDEVQVRATLQRDQLAAAARRVENLRDELIAAQIDQRANREIGDEATQEQIAAGNLASARVAAISDLLAAQEATLEELVNQRRSQARGSVDLLANKAELQVLEREVQSLVAEISRLESQLLEPSRVTLVQPAVIP